MPYPSISFLEQLEPAVGRALKKFGAMLTFFLSQEHKDDGTHGAVTATSLTTGAITATSVTSSGSVQGSSLSSTTGSVVSFGNLYERGRTAAIGEWTDVAFAAGNFTASTGNWTLTSGDQVLYRYMLIGKTLWLSFRFDTTSVSAGTAQLRVTLPASLTAAKDGFCGSLIYNDNGAGFLGGGHIYATSGLTYIEFHTTNLANWNIAANTTYVWGQAMVEIQ